MPNIFLILLHFFIAKKLEKEVTIFLELPRRTLVFSERLAWREFSRKRARFRRNEMVRKIDNQSIKTVFPACEFCLTDLYDL